MTERNANRPGYKKTRAGWIPEEWECARLGSYVSILSGNSPSVYRPKETGKFPFVKVDDLNCGRLEQTRARQYSNVPKGLVPTGSILFAKRGAAISTNKVRIAACELVIDSNMMAILPGEGLHPRFLYYFIVGERLWRIADTSTIPQINNKHIKPHPIPLPPLPEQERIAEVLSAWDRAIDLTDKLIDAKQRLKKGLMQKLLTGRLRFPEFGPPAQKAGELPEGWDIQPICSVAQVSFSGVDKKSHSGETPVYLCNYMDVYENDYITPDLNFMQATASESEIASFSLRKGDVLITKDSETPDDIGVPAVVTENLRGVVCGYHLALIRPNPEKAVPVFLSKELGSSRSRRHFSTHANGATRFGLSNSAVKKAQVHLPPIGEQKSIAAALHACDREIQMLTRKREYLQEQKKGLMQKLLTGEVRLLDPTRDSRKAKA